jgi:hypothetical protein
MSLVPPCLSLVPCLIFEKPRPLLLHKSLIKTWPFLQNCENALILANFGRALSKIYFLACNDNPKSAVNKALIPWKSATNTDHYVYCYPYFDFPVLWLED